MKRLGEITLYPPYVRGPVEHHFAVERVSIRAPGKHPSHVYADLEVYVAGSYQVFPDWPSLRAYVETKMALGILGDEE